MIINVYMVLGLCFLGRVVNDYLNMLFLLITIVMIMRILFPTLAPEPLFHTVTVLPGHSLLTDSTQPEACELVTDTNKCRNYYQLFFTSLHLVSFWLGNLEANICGSVKIKTLS